MPESVNESGAEQFRRLPEQVRLEDTITSVPATTPADPDTGRDTPTAPWATAKPAKP